MDCSNKSHKEVYINAVGMEGEGLCPAGSCGVYRKDRLMCRKRMQDFLGTQWQEQKHVSEELGTVRIN